ncbi:MAG: hypothetical protein NPIRA01_10490 [Nitrospirales bacterium]|nr:MAG: hypothetical protein NPIRA01_10490 [Nitrospirales bacterium]
MMLPGISGGSAHIKYNPTDDGGLGEVKQRLSIHMPNNMRRTPSFMTPVASLGLVELAIQLLMVFWVTVRLKRDTA